VPEIDLEPGRRFGALVELAPLLAFLDRGLELPGEIVGRNGLQAPLAGQVWAAIISRMTSSALPPAPG
jgi:hypothetical protein